MARQLIGSAEGRALCRGFKGVSSFWLTVWAGGRNDAGGQESRDGSVCAKQLQPPTACSKRESGGAKPLWRGLKGVSPLKPIPARGTLNPHKGFWSVDQAL